jgi:hypothetical protein
MASFAAPALPASSSALKDQLVGTSIDAASLLSADYFNLFNEVIMLLSVFPDLHEDLESWRFKSYEQHFEESELPFAELAIQAFHKASPEKRRELAELVSLMHSLVEEARITLRDQLAEGAVDAATDTASRHACELQQLVAAGGYIVHGRQSSMSQSAIDDLF